MYLSAQKRKLMSGLALATAAALLSLPAGAREGGHDGHKHERWPQATLNAAATKQVAQDKVRIVLVAELSDPSQAKVSATLNETLDSVMKDVKGDPKVEARSGNYRLWPFTDKKGGITNWQGRGEIILESTDFEAASALAAKVADRMPIGNIAFSVSREERAKQEQELLAEAVTAFRERAQALTSALGFGSYAIRTIDLGGSGEHYQPAPRMMAMAASADKVAVPLEPGTEVISVSVNGSIFLKTPQK